MPKKLTDEERYYRKQTERDFQKFVINRALNHGWTYYHAPDNKPDQYGRLQNVVKGFPDIVLVKNEKLVFVELKTETGRVSPEQTAWLEKLKKTGCDTFVWRPSMWKKVNSYLAGEITAKNF